MIRTVLVLTGLAACGGGSTPSASAKRPTPAPAAKRTYQEVAKLPDAEIEAACGKGEGVACLVHADKLVPDAEGADENAFEEGLTKAQAFYLKACDLGQGGGCSSAARRIAMKTMDLEAAYKLVVKGCAHGNDPESCMQVANSLKMGYTSDGKNIPKAIQHYEIACKSEGYFRQKAACENAEALKSGKED